MPFSREADPDEDRALPDVSAERSWLRRHEIVPRKRLGQNFLVQPQVASRLVRAMDVLEGAPVLEIGAGAGALTRALLEHGCTIWAVEIDPRLLDLLRERFAGPVRDGRLHILHLDLLKLDPGRLPAHPGGPLFLAGNLPYAITTPILLWALEHRRHFSGAAVLVQREVADRLAAGPGSRAYGSITVWLAYHAAIRRLTTVGPRSFWPVPEVDSALIRMAFHRTPPVHIGSPEALERVLAVTFGQRRKMLRSTIGAAIGDPGLAIRLLEHAEIEPERRAETLSLVEFARLANTLGEALP